MTSKSCPLILCLIIGFDLGNCMSHSPLPKRGTRVLHPNIKVMTLENDGTVMDTWEPSLDLLFVIEKALASKGYDEWENLSSNKVKRDVTSTPPNGNNSDSIDIHRRITKGRELLSGDVVVELIGFVEHDLAAVYNFDKERILVRYADIFWNTNLEFKTLPSCNISFQLNGLTLLPKELSETWKKQSVVGNNRPETEGIQIFGRWMLENMNSFPKFDAAFYSAKYFWTGMAFLASACLIREDKHMSVLVFKDTGIETDDVTLDALVTHELGHLLGAPHDQEVDQDHPGYLMSDTARYYMFSEISDEKLGAFIRARESACLRKMDEPDTSMSLATKRRKLKTKISMDDQCKKFLNNPLATAKEDSGCAIYELKCVDTGNYTFAYIPFSAQQGAPCLEKEGGVCFFHKYCILPRSLLINVVESMCLHVTDLHKNESSVEVKDCANPATQFDGFLISKVDESGNNMIEAFSFSIPEHDVYTTCLHSEPNMDGKMDKITVHVCEKTSESQLWEKVPVENDEFLLRNKATQKCLKPVGNYVVGHSKCDMKGKAFRWRMEEIPF